MLTFRTFHDLIYIKFSLFNLTLENLINILLQYIRLIFRMFLETTGVHFNVSFKNIIKIYIEKSHLNN